MNPKELKAKFPYMFSGEDIIGFSFAKGWQPIFVKLCQDIDALLGEDKHGFHWVQVNEKWGYARFYWEMSGQPRRLHVSVVTSTGVNEYVPRPVGDLASQIDALVRQATIATQSRCIVCGQPATTDVYAFYVLVLCRHHARQRRVEALESPWYSDEEVR